MWASDTEKQQHFRDTTCERKPADKDDIRFETTHLTDGMEETPFMVEVIDDTGTVVRTDFYSSMEEVYSMVNAHREAQVRREEADRLGVHPLEIEFAPFGPAWQREREEGGR
jgi:hypothetical protein